MIAAVKVTYGLAAHNECDAKCNAQCNPKYNALCNAAVATLATDDEPWCLDDFMARSRNLWNKHAWGGWLWI